MGEMTDKLSGKAKQVSGILTGDKKLEAEGKGDEAKGGLKGKMNEVLDDAAKKVEDIKKKVNDQ